MSGLKFTIDSEAWAAGFAAGLAGQAPQTPPGVGLAFRAGKTLTACPYPARSPEALSWHSGFIEGRAKREWNERGNCLKPRP
jgi:hypothetical protein